MVTVGDIRVTVEFYVIHTCQQLINVCVAVLQGTQCMLSVSLVVTLICRFMVVAETIEKLRSTYFEEFVDVSNVEYWDKVCHFSITHGTE